MKDSLKPGLEYELVYRVPESKTVPYLYPEAREFQVMPRVFATGFMVGFVEWACLLAIIAHLDWPAEQSVGTHVNLSHSAATPPGMEVRAKVKLLEVDGRRLVFDVEADDGVDTICKGTHERFLIDAAKFIAKVNAKAQSG
jgi:fluoroacetyl-CoA thioesterase